MKNQERLPLSNSVDYSQTLIDDDADYFNPNDDFNNEEVDSEESSLKKPDKKINPLQVIWSPKDAFVIVNQLKKYTSVVSSFLCDDENPPNSNIFLPIDRRFRVMNLFSLDPSISGLKITGEEIELDVLKKTPSEIFPKLGTGWIHFNYRVFEKGKGKSLIRTYEIDDRLIIKEIENKSQIEFSKPNIDWFQPKGIKVFPVLCHKGFILCIATATKAILYLTLLSPSKLIVGFCNSLEIQKLLQNIFGLFPFFNISINQKQIGIVSIKRYPKIIDFIGDLGKAPAMIKFEYSFVGKNSTLTHMGDIFSPEVDNIISA